MGKKANSDVGKRQPLESEQHADTLEKQKNTAAAVPGAPEIAKLTPPAGC